MLPIGNEAIPSLRDDDHSTVGCFFLQRSSGRSYLGRRARQHHAVWAHEHRNSAARFTRENILASFRRRARRFRWRVLSPISPDRQISWLSISFCKNIPIYRIPKSDAYSLPSRSFQGGGSRSSRYVGRDVVDVECAFDERRRPGRPSRVVLTPRGRRQAGGILFAGDGVKQTLIAGESTR
jgi:hypothetical protein